MRPLAISAALFVAISAASSASAAPRPLDFRDRGSSTTAPVSDGYRFAGWQTSLGEAVLMDRVPAQLERLNPPQCAGTVDGKPPKAELAALGGGNILWACWQATTSAYPLVQKIGTQTAQPVPNVGPGFDAQAFPDHITFTGIGRRWMTAVELVGRGTTREIYISLSGEVRRESGAMARTAVDLNQDDLLVKLCDGMKRPTSAGDETTAAGLEPFQYDRPFGLALPFRSSSDRPLKLQRCKRRSQIVARCPAICTNVKLTGPRLVWAHAGRVYGRLLSRDRVWRSRPDRGAGTVLAATAQTIVAGEPTPDGLSWSIETARWGR